MNPSAKKIMVFDIGGTTLRGAVYCPETQSLSHNTVKETPNRITLPNISIEKIYTELINSINSTSKEIQKQTTVSAACIAFPGPVDRKGRIVSAPGIWGRNPSGPIDMINDLKNIWPGLPIHICNDLTAAGYRYLAGSNDSFCLITVSTGIGNKIFINGVPQLGSNGTAGEIGHAKVLFTKDAPVCDCGVKGHLQAISSGRGVLEVIKHQALIKPKNFNTSLLRKMHDKPETITNLSIAEAFRASDTFTVNMVNESIRPLAAMLVNLHLAIGLERFIIIGGFAFALGEPYRLSLVRFASQLYWLPQTDWHEMIKFGYKDDLSGLIGAGKLALNRF